MKERGRKGKSFHSRQGGKLPENVCKKLKEKGLSADGLIFSCIGDMNRDACYCDAWIFFDEKGLYIVTGTEKIVKSKHGHKHLEPEITIDEIVSIPAEDIDCLEAEQYTSTGRLVVSKDGEQSPLVYFSLGKVGAFANLCKAYNSYKETGKAEIPAEDEPDGNKCEKCGKPCPPGKKFCRKHEKNKGTAVRLIKFFGGYYLQIALIILVMVASSVVTVFVPQVSTKMLYDEVLADAGNTSMLSQSVKALGTLVLTVIGIKLVNVGLTIFQQYLSASIMPRVMYSIKVKIFEAMQRLSVGFYSSKQTGSLMDRVTRDANNIYWFFTDGIPRVIIDGATIIGVLVMMFRMSVRLSLMTVLVAPFMMLTLVLGDRFFSRLHHRNWVYHAKLSSMISDNINGQRVIKAFAKENDEYEHFSDLSEESMNAEIKLGVTEATLFPILEIFVLMLTTVVLGIGGVMVAKGTDGLTAGALLSFIVYVEMLKEPFGFLSWVSNWWARCADSAQRVFEICDAEPDITEKENAVGFDNLRGDIEINELEFEYEPARPVIRKFSLHVDAGDMLGIVGKTGAGKTTIANLIARLYDAKEGSVKIDGIDVRDLKLGELRRNIGLVSQDIYLFIGSIADNIRYAKPDATMDEVIAASKAACAHDYIMKLPDGYETRVGAGGQRLSGGEKQRISIARTIIQNPKILILDEATAAMDTETERNIQHSLNQLTKGRTTIAIAHRLSTLRDSDYLAVISEGTICEYGTFDELIRQKGEFFKQYKIQSEALKTIGIGDGAEGEITGEEEDND